MTESIILTTSLFWLIILLITKVRDERKIERINFSHFEKEAIQKKQFYTKLLAKLNKIQDNEMSLEEYIKEVEEKVKNI